MSPGDRGQPPPEQTGEGDAEAPAVNDRWWVETGDKQREKAPPPANVAGASFFRAGAGFDQETARSRLTDLNMKLLIEANPPEGGWGYVQLAEKPFPARDRERIKERIALPRYARGAVIDSGRTIRLLITGTPIGQRILELALGDNPSFDCWIDADWVREDLFESQRKALGALRRYIQEFLSPQGIAAWEAMRAQA